MPSLEVSIPAKLGFLFEPHPYKVAHGGRGSGKSWSFARALLILGARAPLRILCVRELQNSIAESVHKLLSDQISELGLDWNYPSELVTQTSIRGVNGTEFIFAGIKTDPKKIKSTEGVNVTWVEEAETVSEESWRTLIPTVRRTQGAEIWITFNPYLMDDPTYQRFVVFPPPRAKVVEVNYRDNPWFPEGLEEERLADRARDPEMYKHVWEGQCLPAGDNQLIGLGEAFDASLRCYEPAEYSHAPRVLGVDVARYGGDRSVIAKRQGLVALDPVVFRRISNMDLAAKVAETIEEWQPDAVFIDAGRGEGVIDRLLQLRYEVIGVNFGGSPINAKYANKRAEMWAELAEWIKTKGQIPRNQELISALAMPVYTFSNKANKFELEAKEKTKARNRGISPDPGDALALTFAFPVAVRRLQGGLPLSALRREGISLRRTPREYNPYDQM